MGTSDAAGPSGTVSGALGEGQGQQFAQGTPLWQTHVQHSPGTPDMGAARLKIPW